MNLNHINFLFHYISFLLNFFNLSLFLFLSLSLSHSLSLFLTLSLSLSHPLSLSSTLFLTHSPAKHHLLWVSKKRGTLSLLGKSLCVLFLALIGVNMVCVWCVLKASWREEPVVRSTKKVRQSQHLENIDLQTLLIKRITNQVKL